MNLKKKKKEYTTKLLTYRATITCSNPNYKALNSEPEVACKETSQKKKFTTKIHFPIPATKRKKKGKKNIYIYQAISFPSHSLTLCR